MSILLTTTCDYAILVAIQQGRHFSHSEEHDICIQSKLELLLPKPVDDLIPPTTIINTAPATIAADGSVHFQTTLVYLVSTKLLSRLRTYNAQISLTISSLSVDASSSNLGTIRLHLSGAKMVVQHHGQRQLNEVNQFVVDKGAWQSIPNRREQIKAGLFIVAMPDKKQQQPKYDAASEPSLELRSLGNSSFLLSPSSGSQHSSNSGVETPLLFSDNTTATTTLLSSPPSVSFSPKKRIMTPEQQQQRRKTTTTNFSFIESSKQQQKQLQRQRRHVTSSKKVLTTERLANELFEDHDERPASTVPYLKAPPLPLRSLSAKDTVESAGNKEEPSSHRSSPEQFIKARTDRLRRVRSHVDLIRSTEKGNSDDDDSSHHHHNNRRRGYSSVLDLNIEQLSAALRHIKLFASDTISPSSSPRSPRRPSNLRKRTALVPTPVEHRGIDNVSRYHQIGKGMLPYTFYFNIVHADHIQPLLRRSNSKSTRRGIQFKPFFSYAILSSKVMCPASSLSGHRSGPSCFHLRGYLYDIQKWLDDQCRIELSLVLQDDRQDGLNKEMVGMAQIPLGGLAYDVPTPSIHSYGEASEDQVTSAINRILTERSFPIYDTNRRDLSITPAEEIAKVTVRFGLVSGWWKNTVESPDGNNSGSSRVMSPTKPPGSKRSNGSDPWDYLKNKKLRQLDEDQVEHGRSQPPPIGSSFTYRRYLCDRKGHVNTKQA
ncbi:hypothetical protein DFQ29_005578 [Apophysomyces sp. BC1021]|nr:hypothetical protein DFQ29_005578 [Apophysomyces sp. BC1021]